VYGWFWRLYEKTAMNIGPGHWIFAGLFALSFIAAMVFAYRSDSKKSPQYFTGSTRFLLGVILIVMLLVVLKILHRLS
jgi:cytochrome bd-type quinol oxidase subunit 1